MRATPSMLASLLAPILLIGGCGGAGAFGPEWTVARAQPAAPAEPALVLGAIVLAAPESSEPLLVLDDDGTVHHANCPMTLGVDGVARTSDGATVVLTVLDGAILAADGSELYRLERDRLIRGDGRAAWIEGDRVTFEESPEVALRVVGASGPALTRTALVLVAALAVCGG